MIILQKSAVMKSILILFCVFYFAMLCLTGFAIVYSSRDIAPSVFMKTGTVNYCKHVVIPINGSRGSDMFMHPDLSQIP